MPPNINVHVWLTSKEQRGRNAQPADLTQSRRDNYTSAIISTSVIPKICLSHFQHKRRTNNRESATHKQTASGFGSPARSSPFASTPTDGAETRARSYRHRRRKRRRRPGGASLLSSRGLHHRLSSAFSCRPQSHVAPLCAGLAVGKTCCARSG